MTLIRRVHPVARVLYAAYVLLCALLLWAIFARDWTPPAWLSFALIGAPILIGLVDLVVGRGWRDLPRPAWRQPTATARWAPDPSGSADLRWWDGTQWTEARRARDDRSPTTEVPATEG